MTKFRNSFLSSRQRNQNIGLIVSNYDIYEPKIDFYAQSSIETIRLQPATERRRFPISMLDISRLFVSQCDKFSQLLPLFANYKHVTQVPRSYVSETAEPAI